MQQQGSEAPRSRYRPTSTVTTPGLIDRASIHAQFASKTILPFWTNGQPMKHWPLFFAHHFLKSADLSWDCLMPRRSPSCPAATRGSPAQSKALDAQVLAPSNRLYDFNRKPSKSAGHVLPGNEACLTGVLKRAVTNITAPPVRDRG